MIKTNKLKTISLKIAAISVAIFTVVLGVWVLQNTARADGFSWTSGGEIGYSVDEDQDRVASEDCVDQEVIVQGLPNRTYPNGSEVTVCVYDQGYLRYGYYQRLYKSWPSNKMEGGVAVSVSQDTKMYPLTSGGGVLPDFNPSSNKIIYSNMPASGSNGSALEIYTDGLSRLEKTSDNLYFFDRISSDFLLQRPNGYILPVRTVKSSDNGKWLVFQAVNLGVFRMNLETFELKRISNLSPTFGVGLNPTMDFAVTDDGQYVAVGGLNTPFYLYRVTEECGDVTVTDEMTKNTPVVVPCDEVNLGHVAAQHTNFYQAHDLKFSDKEGGALIARLVYQPAQGGNSEWITLQAPGYTPPPQLDYLALGDSFASGEGDIHWESGNRINHYLPGTDIAGDYSQGIPREKCHISSRSYPSQLASLMQIDSNDAKSVACSGAKRIDVHGYDVQRGTNVYKGQEVNVSGEKKPRLAGLSNINFLQTEAKESFVPGRVQQIEFVERNAPKVATVSMGGNDIGFGDVIVACVSKIVPTNTCSQAEGEGKAILGKAIRGQFTNLRDMYVRLKEASQGVKLYVVGYPQFISDSGSTCTLSVPLNASERTMMVEGVSYLNSIAKTAAAEAGVGYIDVEDSLGEHVLCGTESEKYVNGILSLGEPQEMFHPNADGHAAMYQTIADALNGQSLQDDVCNSVIVCPDPANAVLPPVPDYFAEPVSTYDWIVQQAEGLRKITEDAVEVVTDTVQQAAEAAVKLSPTSFQPTSTVTVEVHSDPVELGIFEVAADGSLDADIVVPEDMPAGYHTLHIYGFSYSGEPIDYYQIIQVEESGDEPPEGSGE